MPETIKIMKPADTKFTGKDTSMATIITWIQCESTTGGQKFPKIRPISGDHQNFESSPNHHHYK